LLRVPYLVMVEKETSLPADQYTDTRVVASSAEPLYADPQKIADLLARGTTLLLRNIEHWHAPTADLARGLGDDLGHGVEAFFFLTPSGHQGLVPHRDDADVFVVQVQGLKEWSVHGSPADGSWEPGQVTDPGPVLLKETLRPGDVLYLPRGAAHSAVAAGERMSAHLSLTVREIGSANLLAVVREFLAADLHVPARPLDDAGLEMAASAILQHQRERLAAITPAELVAATRAAQQQTLLSKPLVDLDLGDR
jgi:ribosomal protein L16 Arg81 hydroxylase